MALTYLHYPPNGEPPGGGGERPGDKWPLIIFLHGMGERGDDLSLVEKHGTPRFMKQGGRIRAYVAAPQCPDGVMWGDLLPELDGFLDMLLEKYPIDPDRVFLTGFSMGGWGVCAWACHSPERFAAVAPVAGSELPTGCDPTLFKKLPIWVVHSVGDKAVPVRNADRFVEALKAAGVEVQYTRYDGADHAETSNLAYMQPDLYEWLYSHQRGGAQ